MYEVKALAGNERATFTTSNSISFCVILISLAESFAENILPVFKTKIIPAINATKDRKKNTVINIPFSFAIPSLSLLTLYLL